MNEPALGEKERSDEQKANRPIWGAAVKATVGYTLLTTPITLVSSHQIPTEMITAGIPNRIQ